MNVKIVNLILALLIYLPSCAFVPLNLYLVLIGYAFYLNFNYLKQYVLNLLKFKIIDKNLTFFILLALLSLVLRVLDFNNWDGYKDFYSFAYLFPFTYIISKSVNKEVLKYVIYFILIESVFAITEYICGVTTFFTSLSLYFEFTSYDLLYYTRVFGLSENSSGFSIKLFLGVLLLNIVSFGKVKRLVFELLIMMASVFVFGRIAMISILVFYILKLINSLLSKKKNIFVEYIPIILFVLFFSINFTWSVTQFTRNHSNVTSGRIELHGGESVSSNDLVEGSFTENMGIDKIEMAGRNEIWNSYFNFSLDNLLLGNKAKKYMLGTYHAHNSYLEVLASFGILVFLSLSFIFAFNISKENYIYVLAILFISLGQYVIFWGISFFDIIFYYLAFHYKIKNEK